MVVRALLDNVLTNSNGLLMPHILADFAAFLFITYLVMTIYPALRSSINFRNMTKHIGGPKGHWFFGDAITHGFSHDGLMKCIERCHDFPAMCTHYLTVLPTIQVYHPDVVKTALSREARKSWHYDKFVKPTLKDGLITSNGGFWKRHRRMLTAIFHFDILKEHCLIFNKVGKELSESLNQLSESNAAGDVTPAISLATFNNMMECVMSQSSRDSKGATFIQDIHDLNELLLERQHSPASLFESIYWKTKSGRRLAQVRRNIIEEAQRLVEERRAALKQISGNENAMETHVIADQNGKQFTFRKRRGKAMDFLDVLIQTKDQEGVGLTDDEINDEVLTFFCAGQETVSTGLSWAFYLLARHQDIQTKCREELLEKVGDKEIYDASDIGKLSYLTQCIKETLRLYPPVHAVSRDLSEDTIYTHRFNNYKEAVLKKGTTVIINIFALHRNPHVWKNPEVFDPERFNNDNIKKIPPFALIPFAAGPRNCIGQHFAMNEMKVTLAQVLRQFKLEWDSSRPPIAMNVGITLLPEGGVPIIVKRLAK